MAIEAQLHAAIDRVDARLEELLPDVSAPPQRLHEAMRYSCLSAGKRIRPVLCMVCAEAVGGDALAVVDAACCTEMVHAFSLIHDDLPAIDDDDLRRGMPTCHVKFGEPMAILAGDALFSLAFQVLAASPGPLGRVLQSVQALAQATGSDGLVGGEVLDVQAEGQTVSPECLELIHTRKTGALIAASCEIGALLGGGSSSQVSSLKAYGERLGLAFQIADDLLNELSTPEQLGKAAGTDRARLKATYPALYGVAGAREAAKRLAGEATAQLQETFGDIAILRDLAEYVVERGR